MKHFKPIDIFGYVGAVLIITGLALVSSYVLTPRDVVYQALNFLGGAGIAITAFSRRDYPSGVLNLAFVGIALVSFLVTYIF